MGHASYWANCRANLHILPFSYDREKVCSKREFFRRLPLSTYADFPAFWTPLPPLVRKFTQPRLLSLYATYAFGPTPPLPLCAYVLNGSPLIRLSGAVHRFCIFNPLSLSKSQSREVFFLACILTFLMQLKDDKISDKPYEDDDDDCLFGKDNSGYFFTNLLFFFSHLTDSVFSSCLNFHH